jgi:LuxR family transcriptional regulator/LuxR family quorum-sensing system transcriptional regulator CciR
MQNGEADLTLAGFLTRLHAISSARELWALTLAFYKSRGVARVSYHHYSGDAPNAQRLPGFTIATEGFPEDWVARYLAERLWEIDPIPAAAMKRGRVLRWSDAVLPSRADGAEARFFQAFREADLGDGLAVPLSGPAMRQGYAGLGFLPGAPLPDEAQVAELHSAAQMAHLAYCRIMGDRAATECDATPRELEVLFWIARGKSTAVIADILGVSRHTVDTLTRRLFDKLGVADRTSAAIRGIQLHLVAPP